MNKLTVEFEVVGTETVNIWVNDEFVEKLQEGSISERELYKMILKEDELNFQTVCTEVCWEDVNYFWMEGEE